MLNGKKVLVTAGPCREPLDPVRYISNRSSGKMGYAIAEAARDMGAEVTLVSGPTAINDPAGMTTVRTETTSDMYNAVESHFGDCDILVMAAAPADFRAEEVSANKIKKHDQKLRLNLQPTIDILKALQQKRKPGQVVAGFALETDHAEENAGKKLRAKGLDLIVLNSMEKGAPFDNDFNEVLLLYRNGSREELTRMDKKGLAVQLVQRIADLYNDQLERKT